MSTVGHGACGKEFPGNASHCGGCCETFSGLGLFDDHRLGPTSRHPWTCLPTWYLPAMGLVQGPMGVWGTAEGFAAREAAGDRLRTARRFSTWDEVKARRAAIDELVSDADVWT